jgi:hypothetical protein
VAGRFEVVSNELGIIELGDVCAAMRARNLELFATLGRWVTGTPPGEAQRLFAEACHIHAWHADLWAARTPAIAPVATPPFPPLPTTGVDQDRRWYSDQLAAITRELTELAARIDRELDPSTARVIDLVTADIDALTGRVSR